MIGGWVLVYNYAPARPNKKKDAKTLICATECIIPKNYVLLHSFLKNDS